MHHYDDLITIFHTCFGAEYNTRLVKGDNEPLYLPANGPDACHQIVFAHGYFSSALHECAHWLIAGEARRLLEDYGYWYYPDGRDAEQQVLFEHVEVKPQALEWILAKACGHQFRISNDNLIAAELDATLFKQKVYLQVCRYCEQGLNNRANTFRTALALHYQQAEVLEVKHFTLDEL